MESVEQKGRQKRKCGGRMENNTHKKGEGKSVCGRKKQKSNKGGDAVKVHLHCIRDGLGWPIAPA